MVTFLAEYCREGCTRAAMTAALSGHLKVIKLLYATYNLDWCNKAIENAMSQGQAETAKWLYFHLNQPFWETFAVWAAHYVYPGIYGHGIGLLWR
ncbi:hypothetical protein GQ600_3777 [Phytophthora cactorum]|nr:hypothetical protein GQ600_3777 [Phytophthora cactorum]